MDRDERRTTSGTRRAKTEGPSVIAKHRGIIACETETSEHLNVRPGMRREHRLPDPEVGEEFHFGESLQRGGAWIRHRAAVRH